MPSAALVTSVAAQQRHPPGSSSGGARADMQAYLSRSNPQSPSDALRLLRAAYPNAPLQERVAACGLS